MTQYYFLAMALPPIRLGHKLPISSEELTDLLRIHLSHEDLELVKIIQQPLNSKVQFEEITSTTSGFVKDYLIFEQTCREDWATLRSSGNYKGHLELKELHIQHQDDPLALHLDYLTFKFRKIEEKVGLDLFSKVKILGYVLQFSIAQEWLKVEQKHLDTIEAMAKELR